MKTVPVLIGLLATLVLSGCAGQAVSTDTETEPTGTSDFSPSSTLSEQEIVLKDGRKVTCVVFSYYKQGGTSCDWDTANMALTETDSDNQ